MTTVNIDVARALYHHCQDTDTNCGRTCAQMIIASLALSPMPGSGAPPPAATPVPVGQNTLRLREAFPVDDTVNPSWFTYPDELLGLLTSAPELAPLDRLWVLGNYAKRESLLAHVVLSLKRGLPCVVNVDVSDHWVVVVGVGIDSAGKLQQMRVRDPLPVDPRTHTYIDGCNDAANGESYHDPWPYNLDDPNLKIGTIPPPPGMPSYVGRYVGIFPGQLHAPEKLEDIGTKLRPPRGAPYPPEVPVLKPDVLMTNLAKTAEEWGAKPILPLLGLAPVVRLVKYLDDDSARQYTLTSVYDDGKRYGAAAVHYVDGTVRQMRVFADRRVHESLHGNPDEPLWWARRWLAPGLQSPYFPFALAAAADRLVYTRLFDGRTFLAPRSNVR